MRYGLGVRKMALVEYTLEGTVNKVQIAIDRLRNFEPPEGYYVAFSGGKDSVVVKKLCDLAGVKYDAHYRVTSVDPPELVQFIRDAYPDVSRDVPKDKDGKPITMWTLIPKKLMPPTRPARYCCAQLKETGGKGRITVTGVRWSESVNRKKNQGLVTFATKAKTISGQSRNNGLFVGTERGWVVLNNDNGETRRLVEQCYKNAKTTLNPIIDWTDAEVWEFIREYNVPYCKLYDEGFTRVGCIGCPMNTNAEEEFHRWPKYREQYIRSFEKMIAEIKKRGGNKSPNPFTSGEAVMDWWLHGGSKGSENIEGQIEIGEGENGNQELHDIGGHV